MKTDFLVTHYIRQSPNKFGWTQLPFITQTTNINDKNFYYAFDINNPISPETVLANENDNLIKRIEMPVIIETNQCLWISKERDIWLADFEEPFAGVRRQIECDFNILLDANDEFYIQLEKLNISLDHLKNNDLPSGFRQSIKNLVLATSEDPSLISQVLNKKYSMFTASYIEELEDVFGEIETEVIKLNIGQYNKPHSAAHFDILDNNVYYNVPTLFIYPFFLDDNRKKIAGVIPFAYQKVISIALHKDNPLYLEWIVLRQSHYLNLIPDDVLATDLNINTKLSVAWLVKLINYIDQTNSEIHSIRGYIMHSIIMQFVKENGIDRTMLGDILQAPTDFDNLNKLQFFKDMSGRKIAELKKGSILLLDPADTAGLTSNGNTINSTLHRNYRVINVPHGLQIPVGLGFTLFALPRLLEDDKWQKIQALVQSKLLDKQQLLAKCGISVSDKINHYQF